ncbi:hypothetical protein QE152_g1754 [Popillia japonica]|uniref:Uncharacterized protein n=1 Tax=Popillia japonica TaxID=7064 RepID=A0AAW1N1L3_POPJA
MIHHIKERNILQPESQVVGTTLRGDKSSIDTLLKKHFGLDWRDDPDLHIYKIIDRGIDPHTNDDNIIETGCIDEDPDELRV